METTISKTTTTTNEVVRTDNASYRITATSVNGVLESVQAVVAVQETEYVDGAPMETTVTIGNAAYERGRVRLKATAADDRLNGLMPEFLQIVESIKNR